MERWFDRGLMTLVWVLLAAAWTGCGPNVSLGLPNGYSANVYNASESWVDPPAGVTLTYTSLQGVGSVWVKGLDVQGDLVIGRLADSSRPNAWPIVSYFVIDTRTHTLTEFTNETDWLNGVVAAGGSRDLNLRRITPFFYWGEFAWMFRLGLFVVVGAVAAVMIEKYIKARRHNKVVDEELGLP